jgi:hypothetical protein
MMAKHQRGGRESRTAQRGAEKGNAAEIRVQPVRHRTQERDQHVDAPKAENDRGNGGQQLDDGAKNRRQPAGQEVLSQKDGDGDTEDAAEQQGQQRTVERAPDLREDAELPGLDVPGGRRQEAEAVFGDGRQRLAADLDDDVNHQRQNERGAEPGDATESPVDGVIAGGGWTGHGAGSVNIVEVMRCHESPGEVWVKRSSRVRMAYLFAGLLSPFHRAAGGRAKGRSSRRCY